MYGHTVEGNCIGLVLRGVARVVTAQSEQESKCAISSQARFEETLVFGPTCASDGEKELED